MKYVYAPFTELEKVRAKQAIVPDGMVDHPAAWICPFCKDCLAHGKPHGDYIQRGFEWDRYRTFMQCQKCGNFYYSDYDVWLVKPNRRKRNA